jgi:hypothetical protein
MKESCDHFICVQDGETPLHLACARGAVGLVSELLAAGAQVDALDKVWTVEIRVDLSSSVWMDSHPSCLRERSCRGRACVVGSRSSSRCSRSGLDS